ncbi:MAG: hypothetical protein JKX73_11720 [Flavobacteriales bacterium]|nr:hypothetical protein [Flavobacteriales bacterium]
MKSEEYFDTVCNKPGTWLFRADQLLLAANVLHKKHEEAIANYDENDQILDDDGWIVGDNSPCKKYFPISGTARMLVAFALECYIKATWLTQGHQLAANGNYEGMFKSEGHDLKKLYEKLGYAMSKQEISVLTRLSIISTGMGRYPVQKNHNKGSFPGQQKSESMRWSSPEDDEIVNDLIDKLKKAIKVST